MNQARRNSTPAARSGRLIGRDAVVDELTDLVWSRAHRLVTLVGPPGVGKTRVAVAVADQLRATPELADAVTVVDLTAVDEAHRVLPAIAAACAVGPTDAPLEALAAAAGERDLALVLDNFEHVVDAADDLGRLVEAAPRLSVLVTSRVPLGLASERRMTLAPLDDGAAVALFVERAIAAGAPSGLDTAAVSTICAALDHLPLAIELAAARARVLSVGQIVDRLAAQLQLLAGGSSRAPARQRSMRAAIEWSYHLLDEPCRALLRSLSLLPGTFTADMAEAVGDDTALDLLGVLVDHHLVARDGERLRVPVVVAQYAAELTGPDERVTTMARVTDHLTSLAEHVDAHLYDDDQSSWAGRLSAELDLARDAINWNLDHDRAAALRLAAAVGQYWVEHADPVEGAALLERAASDTTLDPVGRAWALRSAAAMLELVDGYDRAETHLGEAVALFRSAGDWRGVCDAQLTLSSIENDRGNLDRSAALLEQVAAVARDHGDERREVGALVNLGVIAYYRGELTRALGLWERCLRYFRGRGDDVRCAILLANMAALAIDRAEYERALRLADEAVTLQRAVGDRVGANLSLINLSESALHLGDTVRAEAAITEVLATCDELRLDRQRGETLSHVVLLRLLRGERREALQAAVEAVEATERVESPHGRRLALEHAAMVMVALDRPAIAAELLGIRAAARAMVGASPSDDSDSVRALGLAADLRERLDADVFDRCFAAGADPEHTTAGELLRRELRRIVTVEPAAPEPVVPAADLPFGLTQREFEVLGCLAQRCTDREIAERLYISPRTASTHVARILTKLGVDGRRQAAATAQRLGLIAS